MLRAIVFIGFFLSLTSVQAQKFPSDFWHEGRIVLETGDTLHCNIKYDLQNDIIQSELNGRLESFTPRKAVFFEIFDKTSKRYRSFYSLPYSATGQYRATIFFELLAEGKMTLLSRESIEFRNYPSSFYYYGSTSRMVLVNKYFLLKENGDIQAFTGKRNDLLELMGRQQDAVQKYIKANKLSLENKYQFADIVKYYNSLQ
ncbi:MAG: hypothetical protein U0289_11455 [Cyclobacteriaceae bacterium]|jgi:hypothetical protein|nr:hypothetical protein [Cytophagales bacterium]HNP78118.1 hypothetical protein [Cyclobacteriaceae bacterium]